MPSVSVIVPVYKVEDYLERCLGNILSQTFSDFELILVDDGSPDHCCMLCDKYKEKRLAHHSNSQRKRGAVRCRKQGHRYCT